MTLKSIKIATLKVVLTISFFGLFAVNDNLAYQFLGWGICLFIFCKTAKALDKLIPTTKDDLV